MKKTLWALAFLTLGMSQGMGMDKEDLWAGWAICGPDGSGPMDPSVQKRVILVPARDILNSKNDKDCWKTLAKNNIVVVLTQNHPNEDDGKEGKEAGKNFSVIMRGLEFDAETGLKHKFPTKEKSSEGNFFKYSSQTGKQYFSYEKGAFIIVAKGLLDPKGSRFGGFHGLGEFLQAELTSNQTFSLLTTSTNKEDIEKVLGIQKALKLEESKTQKPLKSEKPKAETTTTATKNEKNTEPGKKNTDATNEKKNYTNAYQGEREFDGKTQFLKKDQSLFDFLTRED